ncbi:MAG: TPM domain-containing protein [Patescibacteria group bacterium]|nr:TPM domain-containing protein [Patescibacteria group bacterium]
MRYLLFVCISVLVPCSLVSASEYPEYDGYVTDISGVLSDTEELSLESTIQEIEKVTQSEIAVLLLPTIENEDIALYAINIGEKWGVGKSDIDNGLVLVIAVEDRKWFVATGYGLEGVLPDIRVNRIGETIFPQYFRQGEYGQGIGVFLSEVEEYIQGDASIVSKYEKSSESQGQWIDVLIIILFFAFYVWIVNSSHHTHRSGWLSSGSGWRSPGGFSSGGLG